MLSSLRRELLRIGECYARLSTQRPHLVAAATASSIITAADLTCQAVLQPDQDHGVDWVRTVAQGTFAAWHYGGPAKALYFWYDRIFGVLPTMRTAALSTFFDVYVHSPFLLVPSFYLITGTIKGNNIEQCMLQLQQEWFTASFGTAVFWTPLCLLNFRYVPQHFRILTVAIGTFFFQTWMSWLSNRGRHEQRLSDKRIE
eukprot:gnl/TRDRNA2_/TRDRNA2_94307_c0_seq1.p1 gnl/TRDRNA2_/TRDRNA2_94307_c0~~gnl/TRDRNA2_/TRDRNA2_94307_c0_seq1.p1  ORF type:complete len:200 (-),score=24.56 gnl/TRDRNA2_/TRDRNA2_94307_c0_seq1:258-857(-)